MPGRDIIVVGASAGGVEALMTLARGLPADLPAAVFVVLHITPQSRGYLPQILRKVGPLPADHAVDGEAVAPGRIYVARPDHHMLVEAGRVRLTRGPKENRTRPAIDPLFRSAALEYGPRVAGVILTGALDDGTAGLWAVKDRGGAAVVQDPDEAVVPSMPQAALRQVAVDYRLPLAAIPPTLVRLAAEPIPTAVGDPGPVGLRTEARIALEDKAMEMGIEKLGEMSPFTCPECHGTLVRLASSGGLRFRCHTGHAFTASTLLAELTGSIEDAMWITIRSVQESVMLMRHLAAHARQAGDEPTAAAFERKADEAARRADLLRRTVMQHEKLSDDNIRHGNGS